MSHKQTAAQIVATLVVTLLCAAMPGGGAMAGAWADDAGTPQMLTLTADGLATVLTDMGYTRVEKQDNMVFADADQKLSLGLQIADDHILLVRLYTGKVGADRAKLLEACNAANRVATRGRWYITEDGDLSVEQALETAGGIPRKSFETAVSESEVEYALIMVTSGLLFLMESAPAA